MKSNFEHLKSMSIEELAAWLDEHGQFDNSPWMTWWNQTYCKNCPDIMCHYEDSDYEFPCAYCELHDNKCMFFPDMDEIPDCEQIVKMWLEVEVEQ